MQCVVRTARLMTATAFFALVGLTTLAQAGEGGACCLPGGDCDQVDSEVLCNAIGGILLPDALCADAACGPAACCSDVNCVQLDAYTCISGGREYAGGGTSCLEDPCGIGFGACCDGFQCDLISVDDCNAAGGTFLGAGILCSPNPCQAGSCCLPGSCDLTPQFACQASGGVFVAGADCEDDPCDLPLSCPSNSLFSQNRDTPDTFGALVSEASAGLQRFERYQGVAGSIEALRWWGLDLRLSGNFVECTENDNTFEIGFFEDDAGAPGAAVCSYTLPVNAVDTNVIYSSGGLDAHLIEYNVTLPSDCVLVNGWISLQGLGDEACWFLWMGSPEGDGSSVCVGCVNPDETRDLSICILGTNGGVFGVCCDLSSGQCTDNVEIIDCVATGLRFEPDTSCSQLDPPCMIEDGACCFDDGSPCSIELAVDCVAAGGEWLGGGTDCVLCPIVGACCFDVGACTLETEGVCASLGFTFLGGGSSCDDCPAPPDCPGNSLFGQDPDGPADFLFAGTSEVTTPFQRWDDFGKVGGPIQELTFWGFDLQNVGGNVFNECVETDNTFEVSFHLDAAGVPGSTVCAYTMLASRTPTGILFNGAELNEYHVVLPEACVLTNGWVSIVGAGNADCWFLWTSSGFGDSYCVGCSPKTQDINLAFCLQGDVGSTFGACCNDELTTCTDNVEQSQCLGADLRFEPDVSCNDLEPPCGTIVGACCVPSDCTLGDEATCLLSGGLWLGNGSLCSQCPCDIACRPDAIPEGEPVCFDGYVDEFNGGCPADIPMFTPINLGDTVCGTSGVYPPGDGTVSGKVPDQDWYSFNATQSLELTWSVEAELPTRIWIFDGSDGCPGIPLNSAAAESCTKYSTSITVQPGLHWLLVEAISFSDRSFCGAEYTATLSGPDTCPADVNGDLLVNVVDLTAVILAWGSDDSDADINGDGIVNVGDLTQVIINWGSCVSQNVDPTTQSGAAFGGETSTVRERLGNTDRIPPQVHR